MRKSIKALIYAVVSAALVCLVGWRFGVFSGLSGAELFMALSNSFFAPGALFVAISLISWMSSLGQYDSFGFTFKLIADRFAQRKDTSSYYDYKKEQDEKRKHKGWLGMMMIFGISLCLISVVFLVLYKKFA